MHTKQEIGVSNGIKAGSIGFPSGGISASPTTVITQSSWNPATDVAGMIITFSEEVSGFTVGDITISASGSVSNFATSDNIVFTVDWTLYSGTNTMDVAAEVCTSAATGKDNLAASQYGIGAEQTATLKQDAMTVEDAYIDQANANSNYASNASIYIGEWDTAASLQRTVIKFPLSLIPSTALVKTGTLKLMPNQDHATNSVVLKVYRLLVTFTVSEVTWNKRNASTNWTTAGGFDASDCEQSDIGSLDFGASPTLEQYYSITITPSKVQEQIDGTLTNNGYLLKTTTEDADNLRFYSSEGAAAKRPTLEVVYRVPFNTVATVQHAQLASCPLAVEQMGFEELNGLLYVVAGRAEAAHSDKVYAYDPSTNTWSAKADYPIAVQSLCVRAVGGKLYGISGHDSTGQGTWYADVYEYDPNLNTWTQKADIPTPREDMGSAVIGTKIYVFGGLTTNYLITKVLEVYDTETNTWDETKAAMPDYKHFGDFGCAYGGKVYAVGSSNTFADYPTLHPVQVVYEYDPVGDAWTQKAYLPEPSSYKEIVALGGYLYCVAGATFDTSTYTAKTWRYDPVADSWTQVTDAPYAALGTGLAVYSGSIYMVGGNFSGDPGGAKTDALYRLGFT